MPDRPYTDTDLRTEAARQLAEGAWEADLVAVGQQMQSAEIESQKPEPDEDGTVDPDARGWEWHESLDDDQFDEAQQKIHDLIRGAADVSEWAIDLGADRLEPSTEHEITINGGGQPIARIHFAYEPDMPDEIRTALVEGLEQALDDAEASLTGSPLDEQGDSGSDVFDLISDIAGRLRDATDSGEYHAVGLIYDLANSRTTVADAREQLAEITFRHV